MKKNIKIAFKNFWKNFDHRITFGFLNEFYNLEISDNPDFIIYSVYGSGPKNFDYLPKLNSNIVRILYTAENIRPDMSKCDFAISFCHDNDINDKRHFRIPNYTLRLWANNHKSEDLIKKQKIIYKPSEKLRFCNFIHKNSKGIERNNFFHLLSEYKKVDSPGLHLNNTMYKIGNKHKDKIDFMKQYKFTIAFENSSYPGYTTEKILEAKLSNTIPIYWGNPIIDLDFNTKSFINFYDHGESFKKLKERVKEVDNNDDLYLKYLNTPFLNDNRLTKYLELDYVREVFDTIFSN